MLACVCPGIGRADVELVSVGVGGAPANGDSLSAGSGASSANGRFVVFTSEASNLVPSDTNGQQDVFVRDRTNHTTRLVSLRRDRPSGRRRFQRSRRHLPGRPARRFRLGCRQPRPRRHQRRVRYLCP